MPLTTRCRRCGRLFPVYAQQLKARRGSVNCPQCGTRFNALTGLLDEVIPGSAVEADGRASGGRRRPAATAPAALLTLEEPRRRSRAGSVLWGLGVLLLLAGLAAQAAWWERGTWWLEQTRLRAVAEDLCARLGCRLHLPRLAGTVEILQPTLGEHPVQDGVFRLSVTLINRAPVAQRLPLLQLELYDDHGGLTAARRFPPEQYLPPPSRSGFGPGTATNVMLDLAIPEAAPTGFRLRPY